MLTVGGLADVEGRVLRLGGNLVTLTNAAAHFENNYNII
jgi:hypothetical protein